MKVSIYRTAIFMMAFLCASSAFPQVQHIRHARYPDAPSNDPQLQIPTDQAQSCLNTVDDSRQSYDAFQQFDTFPQPAGKGYLCIALPAGKIFVIDQLSAEADYDSPLPDNAEWYLDVVVGQSEQVIGFVAPKAGSSTGKPHYVLSQPVHIGATGGTRVTLLMHSYVVNKDVAIGETPGTATLSLIGHWEE